MDYDQFDSADNSSGAFGIRPDAGFAPDGGGSTYEIPPDLLVYNHYKAATGENLYPLDHPVIIAGMDRVRKLTTPGSGEPFSLGGQLLAYDPASQTANGAGSGGHVEASGQSGSAVGTAPLPPHLQWVNNPEMLANHLKNFNAKNPLNPSNAPQGVKGVFDTMKAPDQGYYPPKGANKDAATYWYNYHGYPEQYALNKVSKESSGNPNAYAPGSHAAGLAQVTPGAAAEVGFNFLKPNPAYNKLTNPNAKPYILYDEDAWKTAMADPNFGSMVGAMVSRKYLNTTDGDPFKAEAGYLNGLGTLNTYERAGKPWPNQDYIKKMFPGQWPAR